jgi:hypothetical protein
VYRLIASILVLACVGIAWYMSDGRATKADYSETTDNANKALQPSVNNATVANQPANNASRPANNKSFNFGN